MSRRDGEPAGTFGYRDRDYDPRHGRITQQKRPLAITPRPFA
jgi:hypothetical protein